MKKLFKAGKRRLALPALDFTAVLFLSVVLGAWPFLDPQWKNRVWYSVVVGILMVSACIFSAQDRRRLEQRYSQEQSAQIARLQSRTFVLAHRIVKLANETRKVQGYKPLFEPTTAAAAFHEVAVEVLAHFNELAEYDLMISQRVKETIDKGVSTPDEIAIIGAALLGMGQALGSQNARSA